MAWEARREGRGKSCFCTWTPPLPAPPTVSVVIKSQWAFQVIPYYPCGCPVFTHWFLLVLRPPRLRRLNPQHQEETAAGTPQGKLGPSAVVGLVWPFILLLFCKLILSSLGFCPTPPSPPQLSPGPPALPVPPPGRLSAPPRPAPAPFPSQMGQSNYRGKRRIRVRPWASLLTGDSQYSLCHPE